MSKDRRPELKGARVPSVGASETSKNRAAYRRRGTASAAAATAVAAAAAAGRDVLGALLFSLSLNHKQMGLYYAPAFFAYLLGKCLQRRTAAGKVRASRQRPALQFFSFCGGYIAFKLD